MTRIIDRRLNGKNKSAVNRQRFIRRYKEQIKKAVSDAVSERSITDIESSESVSIPAKDIGEPIFEVGDGGNRTRVLPGNKEFLQGDRIPRPQGGGSGGQGSEASKDGEGEDDFVFQISKKEFLDLFFEDLELPNLSKKKLAQNITTFKKVRAGFTLDGVPANMNIIRSMKGALARRIAIGGGYKTQLAELEAELNKLQKKRTKPEEAIAKLEAEIKELKKRVKSIPFIDPIDLRFNHRRNQPQPNTKAVMFCLMDVSGSMDQVRKDIAKRFFILLYLFLNRHYKETEVVFIRHHTTAKEVDEQEFFYSQETGGTVVSSALKLMDEVITKRYPLDEWNIYCAQASDGDNWGNDSPICRSLLAEKIMQKVQYYAYVEITSSFHQSLWREYNVVKEAFENFAMQHIESVKDIYPVFRKLFKRQST